MVVSTQQNLEETPRCTLCPAGCPLALASSGPDMWRTEYPPAESSGMCPRGSSLGELLNHHLRIRTATRRAAGRVQPLSLGEAMRGIVQAAAGQAVTVLLDGSASTEDMVAAAGWCGAWPQAQLCLVIEPADEQLLLGTEASGADYLSAKDLQDCDGFVIIGDAFAANPVCSRAVFDRRVAQPNTPIVVIDPGAGSATKFATHRIDTKAGGELPALKALDSGAGIGAQAGAAIANCKRLGVLIAAEYGRGAPWRQIGYVAGQLARRLGGGLAPQTAGANALAAVRLAGKLGTISLAEAVADKDGIRFAVGCDILGMLGWKDLPVLAAAAALPNQTTEAAEFVLPLALNCELDGTYLLDCASRARTTAILAVPAGVPSSSELIAALAGEAGVTAAKPTTGEAALQRLDAAAPPEAPAEDVPAAPVLLLGRQAVHAGCGALTAHGSWQANAQQTPVVRISAACARRMNLKNLAAVNVRAGGESLPARIRIAPELLDGAVVAPEGLPQARAMMPARIASDTGGVVAGPVTVEMSP